MKKILSFIISGVICIGLSGCTNNDSTTKDETKEDTKVEQNKDDSNEKETDKSSNKSQKSSGETSSESKPYTKTNKKSTKKENQDENIKDGTHLGKEGKKQDEGYVYDPDTDTRDKEYWDSFKEYEDKNTDEQKTKYYINGKEVTYKEWLKSNKKAQQGEEYWDSNKE
ncbi:hypothetical protein [Terrisporobacter glycolicus]|uniref:Lipoprotein n=1 Tax=Terrisporobacter glycolicus ATCC 14880 = DSM 1288 TaxID=1121315 RepID=A0ABZ2EWJ3_9FIRM|nr:hypothetical protein [Terrisporobacter glycolicus]